MAGAASIRWSAPPSAMANRADGYAERLIDAVHQIGDTHAAEIQSEMKSNHPFQNQTGAAEAGLFAKAEPSDTGVRIRAGHGVFYGIYLERKNAGRYAIVLPTLQQHYGSFMSDMKALVG
ncbi:MAG: hypothetical protein ACR2OE_09485 [Thermomicrobiales bacterium]